MLANAFEWTLALVVAHFGVVTLLSWQIFTRTTGATRYLGFALLYPWLAATTLITALGWVADMTALIPALGLVMTTALISGLLLMFRWSPVKQAIAAVPIEWLMGVQIYRVFGIVFLFGWLAGEVPTALGPITAFNDLFVGVTALLVTWLLLRRNAVRLAQAWNIFGLFDFVYAVTLGVLAAPNALRLIHLTPDTAALGLLPLSFIALWAVPLSIMLHVAVLQRLAAMKNRQPTLSVAHSP